MEQTNGGEKVSEGEGETMVHSNGAEKELSSSSRDTTTEDSGGVQKEPSTVPNLFIEVLDMAIASIHSFAAADVRRLARKQQQIHLQHQQHQYEQQAGEEEEAAAAAAEGATPSSTGRLASLRAKKPVLSLDDCDDILALPMTTLEFTRLWQKNRDVFEQNLNPLCSLTATTTGGTKNIKSRDFFTGVLNPYIERLRNRWSANEGYCWDNVKDAREIHFVGDENESAEAVHVIYVDSYWKRIVLTFRGSITTRDWIQDLKLVMSSSPNPLYHKLQAQRSDLDDKHRQQEEPSVSEDDISRYIGLHLGFRDYMYGDASGGNSSTPSLLRKISNQVVETIGKPPLPTMPSSLGWKNHQDSHHLEADTTTELQRGAEDVAQKEPTTNSKEDTRSSSKIQVIFNQLRTLKEKHPDYRIMIAGHSLGGALALIAALEVASDPMLSSLQAPPPPSPTTKTTTTDENDNGNGTTTIVNDSTTTPLPPVTCITFGNPKVGDPSFAAAIQRLERDNKLHCICFHNHGDIVPMIQNPMGTSNGFCHVGFRTLLYSDGLELGRSDESVPRFSHRNKRSVWNVVFGGGRKNTTTTDDNDNHQPEQEEEEENSELPSELLPSAWRLDFSENTSRKGWFWKKKTDRPEEESSSQQQRLLRINMHDYREYVDRLLNLEPVLNELSMRQLYEEQTI